MTNLKPYCSKYTFAPQNWKTNSCSFLLLISIHNVTLNFISGNSILSTNTSNFWYGIYYLPVAGERRHRYSPHYQNATITTRYLAYTTHSEVAPVWARGLSIVCQFWQYRGRAPLRHRSDVPNPPAVSRHRKQNNQYPQKILSPSTNSYYVPTQWSLYTLCRTHSPLNRACGYWKCGTPALVFTKMTVDSRGTSAIVPTSGF